MKKQKQDPKVDGVVGSRVGFSSQMVSTKRWKDQKWFLLCLLLTLMTSWFGSFFFYKPSWFGSPVKFGYGLGQIWIYIVG